MAGNVAVLDYGSSNLRSVVKALEYVADQKQRIILTADPESIIAADRIIFPGQGAIRQCMENLTARGLKEVLLECIRVKPFMGICMGLQCLMETSDEDGGMSALGVIPGRVSRFPEGVRDEQDHVQKIPHMGWNNVYPVLDHPLWKGIESGTRFYFVHSYYVTPDRNDDIAATTKYAVEFTSAVARDNLFAVQFHPEKSQQAGLTMLKNFLGWD